MRKTADNDAAHDERALAGRLRVLAIHLALYFGAMTLAVPANLYFSPGNPWFVLPMVGWGSVLALHVAYVMGLFRMISGKTDV